MSRETRDAKQDAGPAQLVREWAHRAKESAGSALEPLAAQACGKAAAQARAQVLSPQGELEVMARAVTALQGRRSTFTQSDLTRAMSEQPPADLGVMDPAQAAARLPDLAARAIGTGMVAALEPGEWLSIAAELRRADRESVYSAHRRTRYATDAQIARECRIRDRAAERGAPHAEPADVARLLGGSGETLTCCDDA